MVKLGTRCTMDTREKNVRVAKKWIKIIRLHSRAGQYFVIVLMLWYETVILDISIEWNGISVVFYCFKGSIAVNWCHFLNIPDCCSFPNICPYPLNHNVHITDFCFLKNPFFVNAFATSVLRYLVKNIMIFDFVHITQLYYKAHTCNHLSKIRSVVLKTKKKSKHSFAILCQISGWLNYSGSVCVLRPLLLLVIPVFYKPRTLFTWTAIVFSATAVKRFLSWASTDLCAFHT